MNGGVDLIPLFMLALPLASIALMIFGAVRASRKAKERGVSGTKKMIVISLSTVVVTLVLWLLNVGWIRVILIWFPLPLIHSAVFFLTNVFGAGYIFEYTDVKVASILFHVTYALHYVFMPDGGDVGGPYAFMTLIRDSDLVSVISAITVIMLAFHFIILVYMIARIKEIKKMKKEQAKEAQN